MATRAQPHIRVRESNSLGKRISNHVAYALVMYTLLLIFLVSPQMESKGTSILPYFLLVALVGVAILPCRSLERRWKAADACSQSELSNACNRDAVLLWVAAIGVPVLLMTVLWIIP